MEQSFSKALFDVSRKHHLRMVGRYIRGSLKYLGKKAQMQMGKPVGATRFDFKVDVEKQKQCEIAVLVGDLDKKLQGILPCLFISRFVF